MKVALCFSGQIRSFNLIKNDLLKNLIEPNNCDVFMHIWHKHDTSKYINYFNPSDNDYTHYGSYNTDTLKNVVDTLKPVSFQYEYPFIPQNTRSALYSAMKSNQLKSDYENMMGFKYDAVIKSRTDILFQDIFSLDNMVGNVVYLSFRPGGCGGVNDSLAYGSSSIMDVYCDVYDAYKNTERINQPCPEGIIHEHLLNRGVQLQKPPNRYSIIREDQSIIPLN
jgi:hypothetical protein